MGDILNNSFVLYTEYLEHIELLSMEQRGALFTAILAHASQKPEPELDPISQMAFSFIVAQMDRDREKWEQTREKRAKAGRKGGEASSRARRHDEANEANASCASQSEASPSVASQDEPNEAVDVDVDVDVDGNVDDSGCVGQPSVAKRTRTKFKPPTVEDVADYCRERGNGIDPQRFFDYNEARGWMLGKSKMKDWRAAVRTWERGGTEQPGETNRIEFLEGT